jgi:glycosyltransferase involved in cell wall biosynthesis
MFELTNALIELGVPTVPQDEHALLAKEFIHREKDLFRAGAPEKCERIMKSMQRDYDPENAITVHFPMLKFGATYTRFGTFPSLGRREVLYTTGNHAVMADGVRQMANRFEMILAPSRHTLRPYLEAGLSRGRGAVIPHGVDPSIFGPDSTPFPYMTGKRFKFLQTSFPWIYEKGFDLTVQAFGRAFSNRDDAALILRVPHIVNPSKRSSSLGRLEALVKEESARAGAPEIVLLEMDVQPNRRGGIYSGADCYVHPLRAEGFGMTILEAMACGLPVIATPWSGPADFLSPRHAYTLRHSNPIAETGKDGSVKRYHVEPDLDHLVYLMRFVYEHRDEARALGQRASAVVRRDWTWNQAAVKLASLFHLL